MPLSDFDRLCLTCSLPVMACGTRAARDCDYNLATRHDKNLRGSCPLRDRQTSCGFPEVPLWRKSDGMTKFNVAVSGYSEPWLDRERELYRRTGF